jgi:CIC family chloride channel protein
LVESNRAAQAAHRFTAFFGAFRKSRFNEQTVLLVLTLIIGAVVGLVVVAFIVLTENLGSRLYPAGGAAWRRLVMPAFGALITGFLLARYFPNARGSGIPQTKTALFVRDGFIAFRTVIGKFGLSATALASGIALGREGPSVHVGAGIASVLGRRFGLSSSSIKALVPVGAAAALAAAFNTPIAAVLFTLEEVMGDMHAPVLGSIVVSSATSWMVLHLVLGDEPLFHVPSYQLVHPVEFLWYGALGLVGGLVSVAFVKLLLRIRKYFLRLPKSTLWIQPAAGGLLVGIVGWFVPQVVGVGYNWVGQALNGQMVLGTMALLVGLKVLATAGCYGTGNAGGIFGPTLFIGAMMGGAVGDVAHLLMPDYTGSVGAYALVGMGAAFAGIVRVPLTSVIMVFEMTRDYSIIVPLMIANLISFFLSQRFQEEPIYEALLHQDGIHLPSGARARTTLLMVGNAYQPAAQVLSSTETIRQAAGSVDRQRGAWAVVDSGGLRGMITAVQLDQALAAGRGDEPLANVVPEPGPVESLTSANFPHVHADHTIEAALERLASSNLPVLPVVSRANIRELKGTISLEDMLAAYRMGRLADQPAPLATQPRVSPAAIALGALLVLLVLAGFLNYFYRTSRSTRAQRSYRAGVEFVKQNRYEEAVTQFRDALSILRSNENRLALGLALANAGHLDEAATYLDEVVRERPASGPAHLGLARIATQEGQIDQAVSHYRLAIDGSWPEKPQENRLSARMELVDVLNHAGRRPQAQAELLALAAEMPGQPDGQKRVAQMLLDYGLAKEASNVYLDLLRGDARDAEAWHGLGEAHFQLQEFARARQAFQKALEIDAADTVSAGRLGLCDQILALDPRLPGLRAADRYNRSRELLARVVNELRACDPKKADSPEIAAALFSRRRPASYSDSADENEASASQLWRARLQACPTLPAPDDPLAQILGK